MWGDEILATVEVRFNDDETGALRWLSAKDGRSIEELLKHGVDRRPEHSAR